MVTETYADIFCCFYKQAEIVDVRVELWWTNMTLSSTSHCSRICADFFHPTIIMTLYFVIRVTVSS